MALRACHELRRAMANGRSLVEGWTDVGVPVEGRCGGGVLLEINRLGVPVDGVGWRWCAGGGELCRVRHGFFILESLHPKNAQFFIHSLTPFVCIKC